MSQTETTKATKNAGRGICQICEREMTEKKGLLSKHGYKRPGDGFLHGECFGAHRAAFPATDALREYRAIIASMTSDAFAAVNRLSVEAPVFNGQVSFYCENKELREKLNALALRRTSDPYVKMTFTFLPGVVSYDGYEFGYKAALKSKRADARAQLGRLLGELARVDARIALGEAQKSAA